MSQVEIEIVSKEENQLLDRTEVTFKATHAKEGTPQREAVREKLASLLKATKERVIVDAMDSEFGRMETVGYAKVYKTKEAAMKYEREHVLVRNKLKEAVKKEAKAKAAPPPKKEAAPAGSAAPAAPAKPAEKAPEKHEKAEKAEKAEKPAPKKG